MALSESDKQVIKAIVKDEVKPLEGRVTAVEQRLDGVEHGLKALEIRQEHHFADLRGILGDMMSYLKEIPQHRIRIDGHDEQIGRLNGAVFGPPTP